ncbi:MAG: bifunctional 5,10-methylenetetrahydrofolate dehydrogenase/5,10-methenyltetrahydrofolate cyclohydrolase [Chloroflexi bacterium]|nr:MAG: bifunctional 5,10-methylenetetrahydrofolate dehydrogenase/5,10-methenyltetrahydrofolate cyclohydrolase [Chloroflexota bacterium]
MSAELLDGKALAGQLREELAARTSALVARVGAAPRLAIIRFDAEGPSAVYVRSVAMAAERVGISPVVVMLQSDAAQVAVGEQIDELNRDPSVAGIVIAEPLPVGLSKTEVAARIDPAKDVDGAGPENAGWLARGEPRLVPATALSVMTILRRHAIPIAGRLAVVVGRSPVIGRPAAQLLIGADATVVVCHSRTSDLGAETRRAEILVVAAGRPGLIGPDMVSRGCVVIDCGINTTATGVVGDVAFEAVRGSVAAITPVPGGVGPVTSMMVVAQTIDAAERFAEMDIPG